MDHNNLQDFNDYHHIILNWLQARGLTGANDSENIDFNTTRIKPTLQYIYPFFLFLYIAVGLFGLFSNLSLLIIVVRRGWFVDPTFFFLGNLALSDIIKCLFVLPITMANLIIHDWIYGSFLCYFLPMLQCFPIHASMLTLVMIAIDRYRVVIYPMKTRVPAGLSIIAIWVLSVCVVLPYAVYVKYLSLEDVLDESSFRGVGICCHDPQMHIEEFVRATFVALYIMPLAIISFLYVKVSADLKSRKEVLSATSPRQQRGRVNRNQHSDYSYSSSSTGIEPETVSGESGVSVGRESITDDIDPVREQRTQKYMICMVVLFALLWAPVTILALVTNFVIETEDNMGHFDLTYTTFTFFGFLSTCVNPVLCAFWQMSHSTRDRLRGYFRISERLNGRHSQCHYVVRAKDLEDSEKNVCHQSCLPTQDINDVATESEIK